MEYTALREAAEKINMFIAEFRFYACEDKGTTINTGNAHSFDKAK